RGHAAPAGLLPAPALELQSRAAEEEPALPRQRRSLYRPHPRAARRLDRTVGFYSNKAVVVTGATGFLARHVVDALLAAGARVQGVGRRPRPADLPPQSEYLAADLRLRAEAQRAFRGAD